MLKRKERHERHRLMVSAQNQCIASQAEHATLPAAALANVPTNPQQQIQMVPGKTQPIESISLQTQPPQLDFNYMQPQVQLPCWQAGVGPGMGCSYKPWEVEGILRSAMPLQYED